jgi:hypothetical protein
MTTLELLVALGIGVVVIGAVLAVAASDVFLAQSEVSDMHQRLRVTTETLWRDLAAAVAIRPYRDGGPSGDPPGTFRMDTITAITPRTTVTYWLKADDRAGVFQLMVASGGSTVDVPVVDNVVDLRFEYFGDPRPPAMATTLADPTGPWTTYGPKPSEIAVPPFGPRENCVFVDNGTAQPSPRLPSLAAEGVHLVPLGAADFSDGPWCPDAGAATRWDADLLRVRSILLTVRVQAASAALRGPAGALFMHGGHARLSQRWAPDLEVSARVAPRNMNHAT